MVQMAEAQTEPMLTLNTKLSSDGQVSSDISVGWCVSDALLREVERREFKNPYIVLVVRHKHTGELDGDELERYTETGYRISKLNAWLTHVYFSRPGDNEVIAFVIDAPDKEKKQWLFNLVGASGRDLLKDDGTPSWNVTDRFSNVIAGGFTLEVKVPKEMFAPEPAAWRKRLVMMMFNDKGKDQCHFRKKFWFGVVPFLIPLTILSMLARIMLLLGGLYMSWDKYNWKSLKPWTGTPISIFDEDGKYTMFQKRRNKHRSRKTVSRRPWPFYVWNQHSLVGLPLVVFVIFNFTHREGNHQVKNSHWGWWHTFWFVNAWFFGILAFGLVALVVLVLTAKLLLHLGFFKKMKARKAAAKLREEQERELEAKRQRNALLNDLSTMVCSTGKAAPLSLSDLPANKRTVALRFYDLKSAVCRPFARG